MDTLAHGIGVTNRFELFYNEDVDPLEILRQQEEEKQRRKVEKTTVKDKKPIKAGKVLTSAPPKKPLESVTNKQVKPDQVEVPNKPRGGKPNERPPRAGGNYHESKEGEKNLRNKDDQFFNPDQRDRDSDFRRGRGGGGYRGRGGRGGERGGRGGGGGGYVPGVEGRTRRMFDRHSGSDKTGVRPVEKRDGAGPGNWGDIRSDINHRKEETTWDEEFEGGDKTRDATWADGEANESTTFGEGEDASKTATEGTTEVTEAKDADQTEEQMQEAVKEMTLDEYKKEQEAKRVVPKFNLRKPGEGEDDKQWKKGYVLKKKPKEEEEDQDEEEDAEDDDFARKAQQKVLLDFQFNFTDSRRGTRGRGRGGRGGPRGGARDNPTRDAPRDDRVRETRGPRGGRDPTKPKSGQQAPRVDDINDFPSLASA